ncbi:MAG: hypothetical protein ACE141_14555 [Bryobacteraceae bacterium]
MASEKERPRSPGVDDSYADLAQKAELAVRVISDPELKMIAFGKILDTLLAGAPADSTTADRTSSRTRSAVAGRTAARRAGPQAHLADLLSEGFFGERRTIADVKIALANRGYHIPLTSLSGPLQQMCKKRLLRREKTKLGENKQAFAYSKW